MRERERHEDQRLDRELIRDLGYARAAEQEHDRGVSWLLKSVERDIRKHGGKVIGRRTELEIKRSVNGELEALRRKHGSLRRGDREQVAEDHGLKVIGGKIVVPDVQIEIERKTGDRELANLEFASKHYHRGVVARKAKAGCIIGARGSNIVSRKVRNGPDISGSILSR